MISHPVNSPHVQLQFHAGFTHQYRFFTSTVSARSLWSIADRLHAEIMHFLVCCDKMTAEWCFPSVANVCKLCNFNAELLNVKTVPSRPRVMCIEPGNEMKGWNCSEAVSMRWKTVDVSPCVCWTLSVHPTHSLKYKLKVGLYLSVSF